MSPIFLCTVRARSPSALQCDSRDEGKHVHCNLSKFSFINQDLLPPTRYLESEMSSYLKNFPCRLETPENELLLFSLVISLNIEEKTKS